MKRRDFLMYAAGGLAATTLGGCRDSAPRAGSASLLATEPVTLDAAAFRAARRYTPLRYGRIVHVERGEGPAALFIHGYPLNGYQWRGALERLAPYRRCITPDLLGLGYTETPETQDLSPSAQTEMLAALLDALGIEAVDIVANDSGGAIAQLFLVRYPQRVRTVLLTNCDVHENSPPEKLRPSIERARQGTYADERLLPQLRDRSTRVARTASVGAPTPIRPISPMKRSSTTSRRSSARRCARRRSTSMRSRSTRIR